MVGGIANLNVGEGISLGANKTTTAVWSAGHWRVITLKTNHPPKVQPDYPYFATGQTTVT